MRILALEPFYGGSHKAFLDGWRSNSRHEFTVLGLPPRRWKWRMRHSAITFASELKQTHYSGQSWDLLWCSDMLNLSEFIGLVRPEIQSLPRVAYFHENQLTYPLREGKERDLHFAFTNFTTALAADQVWFNSQFHRHVFMDALRSYLTNMPDHQSLEEVDAIEAKSTVRYPGIELCFPTTKRSSQGRSGPMKICWNARWEYDKNPDDFFAALRILKSDGIPFRLIVLGESYRSAPAIFGSAKQEFAAEIEHWGYAESRAEYFRLLASADVVVSTAIHEFFGIAIVEAVAAGAIPVLPDRLAYPEVLTRLGIEEAGAGFLYDGSVHHLAERLTWLAGAAGARSCPGAAECFGWATTTKELDSASSNAARMEPRFSR